MADVLCTAAGLPEDSPFWEALDAWTLSLESGSSMTEEVERLEVAGFVTSHPDFLKAVSSPLPIPVDVDDDEDKPDLLEMCFKVLEAVVVGPEKDIGLAYIDGLVIESESWTKVAKSRFHQLAVIPLLSKREDMGIPKLLVSEAAAAMLKACDTSDPSEVAIMQIVDECLESDVDWLEVTYQDIYSDSVREEDKEVLHMAVWTGLKSVVIQWGFVGHLFRHFRRLSLLNTVVPSSLPKAPNAKQQDIIGIFNKAMTVVWDAVAENLRKRSVIDRELFWNIYLDILDAFRDHCSLGPPLLNSALKVLKVMVEVMEAVLPSTRYNVNKAEVWTKAWPFIDALLASSVKWAKQDIKLKNHVKDTIQRTLNFAKFLLQEHKVLLSTSKGVTSASVPFVKAIWAAMQWFRVHDEKLRADCTEVVVRMLEISLSLNFKLESPLVEAIRNYWRGNLKSHLTQTEKDSLQEWSKKYDGEIGMPMAVDLEPTSGSGASALVKSRLLLSAEAQNRPTATVQSTLGWAKTSSTSFAPPLLPTMVNKKVEKAPVKPVSKKPNSKLSQLRQEHYAEVRRDNVIRKVVHVRDITGDDEDGGLKSLANDISPERPKRSIIMLDESNNEINTKKRKPDARRAPISLKKPTGPLRNINSFFKFFLGWDIDSKGEKPPNFSLTISEIPDSFASLEEYAAVFEPFLLLECWEQFKTSRELTDFAKKTSVTVQTSLMLDDFSDVTFNFDVEEARRRKLGENDVVLLESERSKKKHRVMALIRSVKIQRSEATIVARITPSGRQDLIHALHPSSHWSMVNIFSITTLVREFNSLVTLPNLPLCNEIVSPFDRDRPILSDSQVQQTIQTFGVNEPQAEAILIASQQPVGFVLIQGPPGTGKTKTILGLVGSLLTTTAKPIAIPGGKPATSVKRDKLMICAPSNAACDEIVRRIRLGILDSRGMSYAPKLVRLGSSDSISAEVRDLTLLMFAKENQIQAMMKDDPGFKRLPAEHAISQEKWDALVKEHSDLSEERKKLRARETDPAASPADVVDVVKKIKSVSEHISRLDTSIKKLKADRADKAGTVEAIKLRLRGKILSEADIIIQYRMHPHISLFPSLQFYDSRLEDAENMNTLRAVPWHSDEKFPPYAFFNIEWGREKRAGHSLYNPDEVIACVNLVAQICKKFPKTGFMSKIGVITPYKMQTTMLRDKFKECLGAQALTAIEINTNVALTRAKSSLFVLGKATSLCNNDDWRALVENSQERQMFSDVSNPHVAALA
ncbi:DEAD-box type RNA helicase [Irineochytrium annulatum]|nr:DEAD-box type RNA helicase [Irineochytrium annulatum]